MSSQWIKAICKEKEIQRERDTAQIEMARRGEASAPRMFQYLKDQVQKDVAQFCKECSVKLVFNYSPSSKFTVRHSDFPVVELTVTIDGSTISYSQKGKEEHQCRLQGCP